MRIDGALGLLATRNGSWHSRWLGPLGLAVSVLLHVLAIFLFINKHNLHRPERNGFINTIPVEIVTAENGMSPNPATTETHQPSSTELPTNTRVNGDIRQFEMHVFQPLDLDNSHDEPAASGQSVDPNMPVTEHPVPSLNSGVSAKGPSAGPAASVTLRQQLARCWQPIYDGEGSPVSISLVLNIAGAIEQPPKISVPEGAAYGEVAVEAIRRAIYTCAPYNFPASTFDQWHHITLDLIPTQKIAE